MDRIEIVARAMARYHLGRQTFASALNPELIAKISKGAEDKLWPALVEEAKAVLAALDDAAAPKDDVVAPKAVDRSDETLPEPTAVERQTAVRSEAADEFVRVGDEKGEGVSCTGEKIADMNRSGGDSDLSRDLPIAWAEQQHGRPMAPGRRDRTLDGLRSALAALGVSAGNGKATPSPHPDLRKWRSALQSFSSR